MQYDSIQYSDTIPFIIFWNVGITFHYKINAVWNVDIMNIKLSLSDTTQVPKFGSCKLYFHYLHK